jgi:N-acetylglucosamine kinase-like BadF-type ATPase
VVGAEELHAGVDGGGTRTRAVVAKRDLTPLGRGASGPANAATTPLAAVLDAVVEAIRDACEAAGEAPRALAAVSVGLAGIHASGLRARVEEALSRALCGPRVRVYGDAEIALAGVSNEGVGAPGLVLVAGTGTVAFGRNARGQTARAGGWGPLIGDEGSAYTIGRRALAAIVREIDGRGPPTSMKELLCAEEGVSTAEELVRRLPSASATPAEIAAYFPLAAEAARRGDAVARLLLRDAGEEIGRAALSVVRRLGMEDEDFPAATIGGVFTAGELLTEPLARLLHETAPKARLGPPAHPPELGAVRLALSEDA